MEGKLGMKTSGYVAFTIEEPLEDYSGCIKRCYDDNVEPNSHYVSKTSFGYGWPQWKKADSRTRIKSYGIAKCIEKYRSTCYRKTESSGCYGKRSFKIIETPLLDVREPIIYPGPFDYYNRDSWALLQSRFKARLGFTMLPKCITPWTTPYPLWIVTSILARSP